MSVLANKSTEMLFRALKQKCYPTNPRFSNQNKLEHLSERIKAKRRKKILPGSRFQQPIDESPLTGRTKVIKGNFFSHHFVRFFRKWSSQPNGQRLVTSLHLFLLAMQKVQSSFMAVFITSSLEMNWSHPTCTKFVFSELAQGKHAYHFEDYQTDTSECMPFCWMWFCSLWVLSQDTWKENCQGIPAKAWAWFEIEPSLSPDR